MVSSIYPKEGALVGIPAGNEKYLVDDITFSAEEFRVGGGGLIRVGIAIQTAADADYEIIFTLAGTSGNTLDNPIKLNGDLSFVAKSLGYYRFDIQVRPGDKFNIATSLAPTAIRMLRVDKIVFGA